MALPTDVLALNVSGTVLHVRRSTLNYDPSSALSAMARHKRVFIDRPLDAFTWLIDWCRSCGTRALPSEDRALVHNILHEADYWGVDALASACREHLDSPRLLRIATNELNWRQKLDGFLQHCRTRPVHVSIEPGDHLVLYS